MKILTILTALVAATGVAGCTINPAAYATTPVEVSTPQGTVTCQLYTKEQVVWDKAIAAPAGMSITTANNICNAEGKRQKAA